MRNREPPSTAGEPASRRLCVRNGGFLTQPRLRRILHLAGYRITLATPRPGDMNGVWGQSPTAHRGESLAARSGAPILRIEDVFLRSLHPGRSGEPPVGLLLDGQGVHFDASRPSDLEDLLNSNPLDDHALLERARAAMARMRAAHLTKYSATDPKAPAPEPGYVLIVDQTAGDASVRASAGDRARFLEMLTYARQEHPGARFVIKTHPETAQGFRGGHFRDQDASGTITLCDAPLSPWVLLDGATAVYTLSSQMGFEAILAGHRPRVFGTPFYAGWGLSDDETPLPRRTRRLTRTQLFAAAMILYPVWYDVHADRLSGIEQVIDSLDARSRAWREDRHGWIGQQMRLWKRGHLQKFFGQNRRMRFQDDVDRAKAMGRDSAARRMVWAGKARDDDSAQRLEDGFLRSRGLGARLIPPLSLVVDDLGIYYDPRRPSRLEELIKMRAAQMRPDQIERANALIADLVTKNLSKYNLSQELSTGPDYPKGHRILVPGQVEDDASVLTGSPGMTRNADLLACARQNNPDAVILWRPHPDVQAGLRKGTVAHPLKHADAIAQGDDIAALLSQIDEVWTLTSLTGFEALIRQRRVTTLGVPFYAGWGLTRDLGPVPPRRLSGPRPTLQALVHATLIDYPRYFDPVTGLPCAVEVVVDRLAKGRIATPGPVNRALSRLQGLFASQAHLWRR